MLKYLNDRVEERIGAVCEASTELTPMLPAVRGETPRNVLGFEMPAELVAADALARERTAVRALITAYRDDARRLNRSLLDIGIEPIAVITAKAFNKIVDDLGMFTLLPGANGLVAINRTPILALRKGIERGHNAAMWGMSGVIVCLALLGIALFGVPESGAMQLGLVALGITGAIAAMALTAWAVERWQQFAFARRAQAWVASLTWEELLAALSSDYNHGIGSRMFCELNENYYHANNSAFHREIILPPAPREVIDKVCAIAGHNAVAERGHGLHLWIAAEAGAISFRNGIDGLFDLAKINAVLRAEEAARRDPILFVRNQHAVAIIAQYGDLPLEREMIDRIVNSEHLL